MANNFPQVPAGLVLQSLEYQVTFPADFAVGPQSPLTFAGVTTNPTAWFSAGIWGIKFLLDAAGTPGSFDQDAAETAMKAWLGYSAQAMAAVTGLTVAEVSSLITVARSWVWVSADGIGHADWTDSFAWTA